MISKEYPSSKYRDHWGYPLLKVALPVFAFFQIAMITLQVFTYIRASPEVEFLNTRWVLLIAFILETFAFLATCFLAFLVFYSYKLVNLHGTSRESYINDTGVFSNWPMLKFFCVALIILVSFLLLITGLVYGIWQGVICSSPGCVDLMYRLMLIFIGTIVVELIVNALSVGAIFIEYFWISPNPEKSSTMMASAVQGNRFAWGKILTSFSAILSVIMFCAMFFIAAIFWGWEDFLVFYTKMGVTTNIALASGIVTFLLLFVPQLITLILSARYSAEWVTMTWHFVFVIIACVLFFVAHVIMFAWHLITVSIFCYTEPTCDGAPWQTFVSVALALTIVPMIFYFFAGVIFYWGDTMQVGYSRLSKQVSRKKANN